MLLYSHDCERRTKKGDYYGEQEGEINVIFPPQFYNKSRYLPGRGNCGAWYQLRIDAGPNRY